MQKRSLGNSELQIPPIALGGNVFGWTLDEEASFRILDEAFDAGLNFIDTADVYTRFLPGNKGGESETIIGRWMQARNNRSHVIVATKVGMPMGPGAQGLSRAHILRSVENSLRHLQTEYIDLYQSHVDDADTPLEETLDTYAHLVRSGKVRAIGASNYTAARLERALEISQQQGIPRYESVQPIYNLYDRADYEGGLEDVCRRHGLGVVPYFALASGFLTGKYRSPRDLEGKARSQIVGAYLTPRGGAILGALDEAAKSLRSTPASIAVAWLLTRPTVTAPIASVTSSSQLRSLLDAIEIKFERVTLEALDRASGPISG
jgi:aryl-alcohol dehydrogenase-like predicted oxidoreductase